MREKSLQRLAGSARTFFLEFRNLDRKDLSDPEVQKLIDLHGLAVDELIAKYSEKPIQL
jgi:hypothetical protein